MAHNIEITKDIKVVGLPRKKGETLSVSSSIYEDLVVVKKVAKDAKKKTVKK